MSQTGIQSITINTSSNISRSKVNQIVKFGQLIEYNKKNTFLQQSCRKCCKETNYRPPIVFQKALFEVKAIDLQFNFNIFGQSLTWHATKTNCIIF